jgi:hypothetical protein
MEQGSRFNIDEGIWSNLKKLLHRYQTFILEKSAQLTACMYCTYCELFCNVCVIQVLNIFDIQVCVCIEKENWRAAGRAEILCRTVFHMKRK